ncbi:MAG TPA: alpha/beta hydrolase [Dehalococcoidia bacterium]|nr:alpha/beta hydrolase [Dehalococcoidia bacterium]
MTTVTTKPIYDPNAHFEVKVFDVEYRRDGDTVYLARIFQPEGPGPFPTLLDVHGGAWANGDRFMNEVTDIALAESGIVIAAIDFRTSQNAPHPAAQQDIAYATRWLKAHAGDFNGTAESLGGVGWSSGGHQVMLGAMRAAMYSDLPFTEAPELDATLAYVIMGWPVIDPLSRYKLAEGRGNQELMQNHLRYFGSEDGMVEASPPHILQRGESVLLPPALLVQGAQDAGLTRMMAEEFVEAYSLAGGVIELGKYPGEPHGFLREGGPQVGRALAHIKSFIARQL